MHKNPTKPILCYWFGGIFEYPSSSVSLGLANKKWLRKFPFALTTLDDIAYLK